MASLSDQVKSSALEEGADIVGIASAESLSGAPIGKRPTDILPGAKTCVVFAVRHLNGTLRSSNLRLALNNTLALYQEIFHITHRIGRLIEDKGYEAVNIPPAAPLEMSWETRGAMGDFSLRHAGRAAGLGQLGKNGLLVTPRFGPRIRIGAVITDAPLESDLPFETDLCGSCRACVAKCPMNAIPEGGKFNPSSCVKKLSSPTGLPSLIKYMGELIDKPTAEEKKKMLHDPYFWNLYHYLQVGYVTNCIACVTSCPMARK